MLRRKTLGKALPLLLIVQHAVLDEPILGGTAGSVRQCRIGQANRGACLFKRVAPPGAICGTVVTGRLATDVPDQAERCKDPAKQGSNRGTAKDLRSFPPERTRRKIKAAPSAEICDFCRTGAQNRPVFRATRTAASGRQKAVRGRGSRRRHESPDGEGSLVATSSEDVPAGARILSTRSEGTTTPQLTMNWIA